jgi:transcriptional regulator with XRE-family HTH domain
MEERHLLPAQVRAARALLGWSQQDLAKRANVAASTIADFERGQREPVANNLAAIGNALGQAGITFLPGGAIVGPVSRIPKPKASGVPIRWIDATDLSHWADRRDGQDTMPELLSRLIRAAYGHGAQLNFPSGDSVQESGWDGMCEVEEGSGYVPAGISGWEIGTQRQKIRAKADSDYEKRSGDSLSECLNTTFVFVTPRRWAKKREWMQKRKLEGKWKDVRAYDANDLVHWIELLPSVGHWLATLIRKRPAALRSLSEAWREWSLSTKYPMSSELLLAGRDEEAMRILRWLYAEPSVLAVRADSTSEAVAFLHSAADQLPAEYRDDYQGRCLLPATPESARALGDSPSSLIIALEDAFAGLAAQLVGQGHHVYIVHGSETGAPDDAIALPRPPAELFAGALVSMGMDKQDAERLARESARSLSILRRLIPSAPGWEPPEWAKPDRARELVAVLLAGAWNEIHQPDRKAIEQLSGEKYESIEARLSRWATVPDSPFRKAGSTWKVASPRDAWFLLAPYINSGDLDRFATVADQVLGSPDPRFHMKSDERWLAAARGQSPEYSGLLRTGLAETLVLLSVFGRRARGVSDASARADAIVRKLIDSASAERWWSISPQIQVLAEASPMIFLAAIDESLTRSEPPVMALFQEDAGPLGSAHHSELLWALEILAWSPSHIARVSELLAKLTRLDPPGGRWANRPFNSLVSVFRLWMPQTHATLDERQQVLKLLRKNEPDIAWRLMIAILPGGYDTASPSPRPRWRDFSTKQPEVITYGLIGKGAAVIANSMLEDVKLGNMRWKQLFEVFPNLPPDSRTRAVELLVDEAPTLGNDSSRVEIWEALRALLHHHRAFPNAQWALPANQLEGVEKAYTAIAPGGVVERIAWLFSKPGADLPVPALNDWEADERESDKLRREAVRELLDAEDRSSICALVSQVKMPALVGIAVVDANGKEEMKERIVFDALQRGDSASANFAAGMAHAFCKRDGETWAATFLERDDLRRLPNEVISKTLLLMPQSRQIWERASAFGSEVEHAYWSRINMPGVGNDRETLEFVVGKLMTVGRAREAASLAAYRGKELPSEIVVKILTEAAREPLHGGTGLNDHSMFLFSVEELLQRLDKANDVAEDEVARLEWIYLSMLEHSRRPPVVLHKTLSTSPEFFVQVLRSVYRPARDSGIQEEVVEDSKQARALASHAYGLLRSWHRVPGDTGGTIDSAALQEWVKRARALCAEAGRGDIGDQHIGNVLASSPAEPDGVWPAKAVRELIERTPSQHLHTGVMLGIHNNRGGTWRGLADGGAQERSIASRYHEYAKATELEWPRTSALLEQIARSYEEEGQQHDQRAERTDWSL